MDKIATENLFLLEFLVDSVKLDPSCDCDDDGNEGEKCVSFQFLDNAPLDVCEADFNPQRSYDSKCPKDTNVKSGKSCLFSLSPEQAEDAMNKLDIYVTIRKKMPPEWIPENIDIGSALISIANLFEELINSIASPGEEGTTPTAKTLKDDFDIISAGGDSCGKIGVYVRMSCFGKLIVTQFQMNLQDKSVLFKDKEGKSLYRYKKAGKGSKSEGCTPKSILSNKANGNGNRRSSTGSKQSKQGGKQGGDACTCNAPDSTPSTANGNGQDSCVNTCPFKPCLIEQQNGKGFGAAGALASFGAANNVVGTGGFMGGGMPGMGYAGGMPGAGGTGCNSGNYPGRGSLGMGYPGAGAQGMGFPGVGGPQMGGGAPPGGDVPCNECGKLPNPPCFQPAAFGGGMGGFNGGYGGGGYPGQSSAPQNVPCSECQPCPYANDGDSCTCPKSDGPDGNYQEIGATMGGNSLTIRVHKDKGQVEPVDDTTTESCICGAPTNNMDVNMQPGVQQRGKEYPFSFKMGQQGQPGGNNVVVNPPTSTAANGAKVTEFSDPNKELFVLRIGKKSEGVDKKQNLELELCTPKGPELKPIPQKKTVDTQYDPKDAGPEGKKGKKGGKGGKGGKKKK